MISCPTGQYNMNWQFIAASSSREKESLCLKSWDQKFWASCILLTWAFKNKTATKNDCLLARPECRHWKDDPKIFCMSDIWKQQPEGAPHIHKDTLATLETRWYRHLHPEMFKLPNPCWLPQQVLWSWQADRYVCKQGHLKTDSKYCQTWHTTLHHVRQC